jgi:hypothetical protein
MSGAGSVTPWEIDPSLKAKRLLLLARLAVETRAEALAEADREAGDTNWGIGCKAHERFCHRVQKLAETTERSWLRVHRDGLSLVSFFEGVAVRAYHGDAERPHARHVYAAQAESHREAPDPRQLALAFGDEMVLPPAERWAWLMAVETDDEGRAEQVVFFQANAQGAKRHRWVAPVAIERVGPRQQTLEEQEKREAAKATVTRKRTTQIALA